MTLAASLDSHDPFRSIRSLREARLLSQELLASAAGVSLSTVTRLERGKSVSGESLKAVCAVLGVDAVSVAANLPRQGDESATSPVAAPPGKAVASEGLDSVARRLTACLLASALGLLALDLGMYVAQTIMRPRNAAVMGMFAEFEIRRVAQDVNQASAIYSATLPTDHADRSWDPWARQKPVTWLDCRIPVLWDVFAGWPQTCHTKGIDERVVRRDPSATAFVVGPATSAQIRSVLSLLTADPTVAFRAAVTLSGDAPPERTGWSDPRGSDSIPSTPEGERGFLHLTVGGRS